MLVLLQTLFKHRKGEICRVSVALMHCNCKTSSERAEGRKGIALRSRCLPKHALLKALSAVSACSGGSDWETIHVLQINNDTGAATVLNDTLNNVKFSSTAWSPDSKVCSRSAIRVLRLNPETFTCLTHNTSFTNQYGLVSLCVIVWTTPASMF